MSSGLLRCSAWWMSTLNVTSSKIWMLINTAGRVPDIAFSWVVGISTDPSGRAVAKAWVCGRSLAGIVGSYPAGGMDAPRQAIIYAFIACTGTIFTPTNPNNFTTRKVLEFFRRHPNDFLSRLVTMDETWLYHYEPETKQQSMEWPQSGSTRPQKFRVQKSAGKVLASIFFFWIKTASSSFIIFQRAKL